MEPVFLTVNGRRLFCLQASPARESVARMLVLPPFAEELNKCRLLLARTVARLAQAGCEVLLPDLFGTGDSAGDFGAARWDAWLDDLAALDAWQTARAPGARPAYLAVRTGALLLGGIRPRLPQYTRADVVLWQPVIDGKRFLQQFLRLRVMASRIASGGDTLESLQQALQAGEAVEIAGYELAPELAAALAAAALAPADLAGARRIVLFEFKSAADARPAQPTARLVDALREGGRDAEVRVIACEPFWTTQEIAAPAIAIDETVAQIVVTAP